MRSDWTQRTAEIGPTVNGTAIYGVPSNFHRLRNLSVGGVPYQRVPDRQTAEEILAGTLAFRAPGIYWVHFDDFSVEYIQISPAPDSDGVSITGRIVFIPNDMDDDSDEPALPAFAHRGIVDDAAAQAYGLDEDNVELTQFYTARFEQRVAELRALRRARASESDELLQEQITAESS